jgi:hypothetical protein
MTCPSPTTPKNSYDIYYRDHATFEIDKDGNPWLVFITVIKTPNLPVTGYVDPYKCYKKLIKNPTIETTNNFLDHVPIVYEYDGNYSIFSQNDEKRKKNQEIINNLIEKCSVDGILVKIKHYELKK